MKKLLFILALTSCSYGPREFEEKGLHGASLHACEGRGYEDCLDTPRVFRNS